MKKSHDNKLLKTLGSKPRTGRIVICKYCNKCFYVKPSSKSVYCSMDCYANDSRKNKMRVCLFCNKQFYRPLSQEFYRGIGKYCSKKCKGKKMSEERSGENSNFWRGGISKKNRLLRSSSRWKKWREAVFKRDNWTCQKCGKKNTYLHPHHIKQFAYFPKLRFVIKNGITLCLNCHKNEHKKND
jgi:5-methylcytosine-specific restriction endonuclease McrA